MIRFVVLGVAALALTSVLGVRAEEPAAAAPAVVAASGPAPQLVTITAPAPARQQRCWKEFRIGSNMPVTHCQAQDPDDADAKQQIRNAQQAMHDLAQARQQLPPKD